MIKTKITIVSGPIHSGKTSALMNWCHEKTDVGGILMPDENGLRKFFNIQTKESINAECLLPDQTNRSLIKVGSYHFYQDAFIQANEILMSSSPELAHIIIDEIGKLELQQKGLYEGTIYLLKRSSQHIVLVVRDYLVEEVINTFNLTNYSVITTISELY